MLENNFGMGVTEQIEYVPFEPEEHLSGILALCDAEGWETFSSDPGQARRAFGAPGVCVVVAVREGEVAGFAQMQSDGTLQAHLSLIAIDARFRKRGVGRRLIEESFERCGGERIDLTSMRGSEPFYESFPHRSFPGYRIYPDSR